MAHEPWPLGVPARGKEWDSDAMTDTDASSRPPTSEGTPQMDDTELAALRARVQELETELAAREIDDGDAEAGGGEAAPPRLRAGWWRTPLVVLLILLASILAPLSVLAQWAHSEIGDTDRYLETVSPLAEDPAVQSAITDRVTQEIVEAVDLQSVTDEALTALSGQSFIPERAAGVLPSLSAPLAGAIESFVHERVQRVVESDTFEQAWVEANRQAHEQMVNVLTGADTDSVEITDTAVTINISSFVAAARELLIEDGFRFAERIPTINASFTIFESADIGRAQKAFAFLDALATVLPFIVLGLILAAVWIAKDRRKAWLGAALGVAASMLLLGLGLNLARPFYLDAIPSEVLPGAAAASIYDALTQFIRVALRAVLVVSLAIALAAVLMAPSGAGAAVRRGVGSGIGRLRDSATGAGLDTGPVGRFLGTYRGFARTLVVVVGAVVYLSVDHPTPQISLVVIIAVVLLLVLLEFLATPPEPVVVEPADDELTPVA